MKKLGFKDLHVKTLGIQVGEGPNNFPFKLFQEKNELWLTSFLLMQKKRWPCIAQCQTSTQKLTDRYLVNFGFEGIIWATLTREKNIFPFGHQ